ncbi:hypothetical protein [Gordonibacter massiliensis (ex Traore et al. 2017)]|uniref:Uncharacterized protein n=1 Tax=Gordonibacter massiliensis (ex Traore et al. 2017) TaxID=1841863 RepID=A0A842J860_9ACTN|nr:hypothetical protein [Gordonibacter massiliensis (ex Traore et al. 2017)]MBC2888192.1 hypothetical protein [Gordonibacter massiliensis (ex Traore et al. 2017)]
MEKRGGEDAESARGNNFCTGEGSEHIASVILGLGEMSYRMEDSRYSALLSASAHILTCLSIMSVALISLLGILLDALRDYSLVIGIAFLSVFAVLLASFVIALIAQFRFHYKELQSPAKIGEYTHSVESEFESKAEVARYYCNCLEESQESLKKRNHKISSLIEVATILLVIAVGILVVWALIIGSIVFSHLV